MSGARIAFVAPGRAELEAFAIPKPQPGKVLLQTLCTLVSRGTERACLLGQVANAHFPCYLGYSAVAKILDSGGVDGFQAGDRVAVYHSSHASHLLKDPADLVPIESPNLASEEAVFAIVAAMGLQGLRKLRTELGESVVVMGLGLLGSFALQCARLSGAVPLLGIDGAESRRRLAIQVGADAVFHHETPDLAAKIIDLTRGGAQAVLEVTGNPEAIKQGLGFMAPQGRIALVGCSRTPTTDLDFYHLVHRPGISIIGAHNFVRPARDTYPGHWTMRADMAMLLRLFTARRIQVKPYITEIVAPEQAPAVFQALAQDGASPTIGTIFRWSPE